MNVLMMKLVCTIGISTLIIFIFCLYLCDVKKLSNKQKEIDDKIDRLHK